MESSSELGPSTNILTIVNGNIKILTITTTVFGFFYLYLYTAKNGIPFPLSLSYLPTLLIINMGVALVILVFCLCIFLLPAIVQNSSTENAYSKIYPENNFRSIKNIRTYLRTFGWSLLLPMALVYISAIIPYSKLAMYFLLPAYFYALIRVAFYTWHVSEAEDKKEAVAITIWVHLISLYWLFFVIILTYKFIPKGISDLWFYVGYFPFALILILINYALVYPKFNFNRFFNKKTIFAIIIIVLISPILASPVGIFLTEKALFSLKLGGNYKAIFFLKNHKDTEYPSKIIEENNRTKELQVILNVGEIKYLRLHENEENIEIYSLHSQDIVSELIIK